MDQHIVSDTFLKNSNSIITNYFTGPPLLDRYTRENLDTKDSFRTKIYR